MITVIDFGRSIYDFANYLIILVVITNFIIFYKFPIKIGIILILGALLPFCTAGVLFPVGYFSDVIQYTHFTQYYRLEIIDLFSSKTFDLSGYPYFKYPGLVPMTAKNFTSIFYSLVPLPYIETFQSLGFFNKFLFSLFIIYLYYSKKVENKYIFLLILYPSLNLYTSLALRDTLIAIAFVLLIINLVEKKFLLVIIFFIIIYYLRTSFAQLLMPIILFYVIFFYETNLFKLIKFKYSPFKIAAIFLLLFFMFNLGEVIIDRINLYRFARFSENFSMPHNLQYKSDIKNLYAANFGYYDLALNFKLLLEIPKSIIVFALFPLPFNADNFFQLFQSLENLIIFVFIIYIFFMSLKKDKFKALFWIAVLLYLFTIFGLISFNTGSNARYRFVLIVMYVLTNYIIYKGDKKKIRN